MPLTNGEKQRASRERHLGVNGGKARIQLFLSISTRAQRGQLARRKRSTVTGMIEKLVASAGRRVTARLSRKVLNVYLAVLSRLLRQKCLGTLNPLRGLRDQIIMSIYYRWIARGPDLQAARLRSLQVAAAPRTSYWIFQIGNRVLGNYMPSQYHGRVLVAFTFNRAGEAILNDQSIWVRFPGPGFQGEAQHPDGIIVKSNEPGAYGVGQRVLQELNRHVLEARLANRQEMSKVLGRAVPQSQVDVRMRNQNW